MFIDCKHERKHMVWSRVSNYAEPLSVRQLRYQCLDCGQQVGGAQRHSLASPDTPDIDVDRLKRATQVHHTTYKHVGNEFLWELRAICDECHDRFHEDGNQ
jgi:5-methylcytosine-specific restriction endonuclease McrA